MTERQSVVVALMQAGICDPAVMAEYTGLPRYDITRCLKELAAQGVVQGSGLVGWSLVAAPETLAVEAPAEAPASSPEMPPEPAVAPSIGVLVWSLTGPVQLPAACEARPVPGQSGVWFVSEAHRSLLPTGLMVVPVGPEILPVLEAHVPDPPQEVQSPAARSAWSRRTPVLPIGAFPAGWPFLDPTTAADVLVGRCLAGRGGDHRTGIAGSPPMVLPVEARSEGSPSLLSGRSPRRLGGSRALDSPG